MEISRLTRDGTAEPSRETKFSGANAAREIFIFPVQLTTCRTGNLTRLIHTLVICVTIHRYIYQPYIHSELVSRGRGIIILKAPFQYRIVSVRTADLSPDITETTDFAHRDAGEHCLCKTILLRNI